MPIRLRLGLASLGLAAACAGHAAAPSAAREPCPPAAPRLVLERFLSADCVACWQGREGAVRDASTFLLDWIVPAARGADAPLAVAALPDAASRAGQAGGLRDDAVLLRRSALPAPSPLRVTVIDGPALNGYVGLQMDVEQRTARLPGGLVGYLALVERVPAGSEETALPRQLVRTLIGPFPLLGLAPGRPAQELRATRFPENARAERLTAVGWVESADGRLLAVGRAPFAGCPVRR